MLGTILAVKERIKCYFGKSGITSPFVNTVCSDEHQENA